MSAAIPATVEQVALSDGCRLHVELRGDGRPVLLIHAGAEDAGAWTAQAEAFARAGFLAIGYDRRGTRHSGRLGWPGDGAPGHARDAAELLRTLGCGPALVVAVSSGAVIGLDLCVSAPALVERAVIHEPPLFGLAPDGMQVFAALEAAVDAVLAQAPGDWAGAYEAFLRDAHGPDAVTGIAPERLVRERANAETFLRDDLVRVAARRYTDAELAPARDRVVLTVGSESSDFLRQAVDALAVCGGWTPHVLEGHGHTPHLVDPAAFARIATASR